MNITVEFYGRLKAEFSQQAIELTISPDQNIEAIYLQLCKRHQIEPNTEVIKPILNDTFSDWQQVVAAGDVVGFFPPASGG